MRSFSPTVIRVGVALALDASDLDDVFRQAEAMVVQAGRFRTGEVARRLHARHGWRPTVVRPGVALPHADVRHLRHCCLLYLRTLRGVDAGAQEPVTDFVVLLAPYPSAPRDHQLLEHMQNGLMTAKLTRMLRDAPDATSAGAALESQLALLDLGSVPLSYRPRRRASLVLHGI